MPTTPSRARVFLKKGKAQVINKTPFSIKLTFETTTYHQKISVGIDPGKIVGLAATSYKKTLFLQEVTTRSDISKNIKTRRDLRRGRRYRNTRYRRKLGFSIGEAQKRPVKIVGGIQKQGKNYVKPALRAQTKGIMTMRRSLKPNLDCLRRLRVSKMPPFNRSKKCLYPLQAR